jgi:hypothetical protein
MYFDSSCEMYAVTVFWADDSDDETVEAHPTSWLSPRRTHCRWPQMNVNNAIKKMAEPHDSWTTHTVKKVLKYTGKSL